ncbi:unnamed protein product [Penicillium bialowiezense]
MCSGKEELHLDFTFKDPSNPVKSNPHLSIRLLRSSDNVLCTISGRYCTLQPDYLSTLRCCKIESEECTSGRRSTFHSYPRPGSQGFAVIVNAFKFPIRLELKALNETKADHEQIRPTASRGTFRNAVLLAKSKSKKALGVIRRVFRSTWLNATEYEMFAVLR